jgi:hypothetical protein
MDIIFYFYILPIIATLIVVYIDKDSPMTLGGYLDDVKYSLIPVVSIIFLIVFTLDKIGGIGLNSRMGKYISTKWNKLMNVNIK